MGLVEGNDGGRLAVVLAKSVDAGLLGVVFALHEAGRDLVALGRAELEVVDGAGVGVGTAPDDALDNEAVGHLKQHDRIELHASFGQRHVERLGLWTGAGEAVEHEAGGGILLADALDDHADDDGVWNEVAPLHEAVGLDAQGRALPYRCPQHVAAGDVGDSKMFDQTGGLGALSSARRANKDHSHGILPAVGRTDGSLAAP